MDNGDIFIDGIDGLSSDGGYVSADSEQEEVVEEGQIADEEEEENDEVIVVGSTEILRQDGVIETTFRFTCNGATRSITVGSTSIIPQEARLELLSLILEWELFIA